MLRQGLARDARRLVVAICALSDVVLIVAGVSGIGAIVEQRAVGARRGALVRRRLPDLVRRQPLLRAAPARSRSTPRAAAERASRRIAVARPLALTWLNPHVYLDTVLLLGSIANHAGPTGRWWFAARRVPGERGVVRRPRVRRAATPARLLASPRAWQVLDILIGLTMLAIAVMLATG